MAHPPSVMQHPRAMDRISAIHYPRIRHPPSAIHTPRNPASFVHRPSTAIHRNRHASVAERRWTRISNKKGSSDSPAARRRRWRRPWAPWAGRTLRARSPASGSSRMSERAATCTAPRAAPSSPASAASWCCAAWRTLGPRRPRTKRRPLSRGHRRRSKETPRGSAPLCTNELTILPNGKHTRSPSGTSQSPFIDPV